MPTRPLRRVEGAAFWRKLQCIMIVAFASVLALRDLVNAEIPSHNRSAGTSIELHITPGIWH